MLKPERQQGPDPGPNRANSRKSVRHRLRSAGLGAALLACSSGVFSACGARSSLPLPFEEESASCSSHEVRPLRVGEVEQMDILFVVDNSRSMSDKQALLRDAIPPLVRRLANPACIDPSTPGMEVEAVEDQCPPGFVREFKPITDLHVAVITSSLGAHGGDVCSTTSGLYDPSVDDHAWLLPTRPRGAELRSYEKLGFLAWDPEQAQRPPGERDLEQLIRDFEAHILAAGDDGCGYEATLEAWYRFLIDPEPPLQVTVDGGQLVKNGVDEVVLEQRANFLRPDSLVAVIVLSDENDCSIKDNGLGYLVSQSAGMLRPTSACADDPNSPCCRPCASTETPPGCPAAQEDPACRGGARLSYFEDDHINLRCFNQKRRFGIDLLYPTARYAIGLQSRTLCPDSIYDDADCNCGFAIERANALGLPTPPCTREQTGDPVPNPLYSNLSQEPAFERLPSQVFLAGIVGVPWRDIATPESLSEPKRLEYLRPAELSATDPATGLTRWQMILGDPLRQVPPSDPLMIESVEERSGVHPITGEPLVDSSSLDPHAHSVNGHERAIVERNDLQYACIFELPEPKSCTPGEYCDCDLERQIKTNPVCQPPEGGEGSNLQYFSNAYPALRHLDVLKRFGSNSVIASICPKSGQDNDDVGFGYRPAVSGLLKRLRCAELDASFETDPNAPTFGTVPCAVVAVSDPGPACDCAGDLRIPPNEALKESMRSQLAAEGRCDGDTGVSCNDLCLCGVPQLAGPALEACQTDASEAPVNPGTGRLIGGWCYVDPARGFGTSEVVGECPAGNLRNVRLLGAAQANPGESLYVACETEQRVCN